MKTRIILSVIMLSFIFSSKIFSQSEAALPILSINMSPTQLGMGATGTALPTEDPFGFLYNPAQLGYNSKSNSISFGFFPSKIEWLKTWADYKLSAHSLNAGYNLKDDINLPISVGIGYSRVEWNFGLINSPQGSFESKDYYHAFSLGLGVDYVLQLSIGFTYKDATSILADMPTSNEINSADAEASVYDLGLLLNVPILKIIDENLIFGGKNKFKPHINFSLGYAKTNVGDEIYYIDPAQGDPLPRMDRIGYGINIGLDLIADELNLNTFNVSFTAEAEDMLISVKNVGTDSTSRYIKEYQSTLSDLKFWKNVVNIEGDNKIVSRTGFAIDLFETFTIYGGHFSGRFISESKTSGLGIRSKGLLKLYSYLANDSVSNFLAEYIDIRYIKTDYLKDTFRETNFEGLSIHFQNITSLF